MLPISRAVSAGSVCPRPNSFGKIAELPITIITAIVSPSARPNAIIALATIPGRIAGSITLINTYSLDKPSASPDFSYVRFAFTSDS